MRRLSVIVAALAATASPLAAQTVAITNGTLVLGDGSDPIVGGTVVVRDGRVVAAGRSVAVPAGAEVVDATNKWVTPGIIDAHSHAAAEAINEGTQSITAEVRMTDVIEHDDLSLYRALAGDENQPGQGARRHIPGNPGRRSREGARAEERQHEPDRVEVAEAPAMSLIVGNKKVEHQREERARGENAPERFAAPVDRARHRDHQ